MDYRLPYYGTSLAMLVTPPMRYITCGIPLLLKYKLSPSCKSGSVNVHELDGTIMPLEKFGIPVRKKLLADMSPAK